MDDLYASEFRYDEDEDRDLDGWRNWSEALMGTSLEYNQYNETSTNVTTVVESSIEDKASNFPLPDLTVTLDYSTARSDKGYDARENDISDGSSTGGSAPITGAKLVIHAYSRFDMNGWPDAVFVKEFPETLDTWPMTVTVGKDELIYGHIREGRNWFYAWLEMDGSSLNVNGGNWPTWTNPEPAAIADDQFNGIEIGYDLNEVTFHLTDKAESFARISWQDNGWEESVYVKIEYIDTIFNKIVEWPRTWIHEGDIIAWNAMNKDAAKNFGLGVYDTLGPNSEIARPYDVSYSRKFAYDANIVSEVFLQSAITNWVHDTLPAPVAYAPINGEIVASSTVEFQFSLDPEYTEFQFELKKGNATVFDSRVLAPGRYRNDAIGKHDLVIWRFPYCVGDKIGSNAFSDNATYTWQVKAYSPGVKAGSNVASGTFQTADFNADSSTGTFASAGKGAIDVKVMYPSGLAFNNANTPSAFIRVQAFRSKSFNGLPDASMAVSAAGTYRLNGLEAGQTYYIRAYIEQDGDAERDDFESWGYYRAEAGAVNPYVQLPAKANIRGNVENPCEVVIRDCDTDNDLLPDAVEWTSANGLKAYGSAIRLSSNIPASRALTSDDTLTSSIVGIQSPSIGGNGRLNTRSLQLLVANGDDSDGDGVSDYEELLVRGSDPARECSDGDGISDGLKRALGFESGTPQSLKVTSITFANGEPVVEWGWDGVENLRRTRSATLATTVTYVVEAKRALTDDEWTTVRTVTTNALDGSTEEANGDADLTEFRFFRVKLTK